jgi:hypothetical protein
MYRGGPVLPRAVRQASALSSSDLTRQQQATPFTSTVRAVPDLSEYAFPGSDEDGRAVRVASAQNGDPFCNVGIWYGNSQWLKGDRGGNLTGCLADDEASIAVSGHTHCPSLGHDPPYDVS